MTGAATSFDIAIIGGGAGGVLTATHALRLATAPLRIALIEPAANLAEGAAYATRHAEHVLNVPARGMSAFAGQPADFVDYLADRTGGERDAIATTFAERRCYADYLRTRLEEARNASCATLEIVPARVVDSGFARDDAVAQLTLDNGATLSARNVILAVGNAPRPLPARGSGALAPTQRIAAWDFDAVKGIDPDAEVCIVGSGLSMADALLSLAGNGHRGRIHVLSRHALLPLAHADRPDVAGFDAQPLFALPLRARMHALRVHARDAMRGGMPWQAVFERLRPHGQALWQSLPEAEQRRFLRHAVRYWDIHRHRVAPQVHARIAALRDSDQLRLHRGRLDHVMLQGRCVRLAYHHADGRFDELDADVLVNATGVELRARTMRSPLLDGLLGRGHARPGPHGIGIDSDDSGRVLDADGRPWPNLFAIGSLRIGTLWESIAVPELRVQAETAARALLLP